MKPIVTALLFFICFVSIAQVRTITGRLLDASTNEPIWGAYIQVQGSSTLLESNFSGFFQADLAKTTDELIVTHIGYGSSKVRIPEHNKFNILLKPQSIQLDAINLGEEAGVDINDHLGQVDTNAITHFSIYKDGFQNLYKKVRSSIISSDHFNGDDFFVKLKLHVSNDGRLEIRSISDSTILPVVKNAMIGLNDWIPASQNGHNIGQDYLLSIYNDNKGQPDLNFEKVFNRAEVNAKPTVEFKQFALAVVKSINYPVEAIRREKEGVVYLSFIVERDGSITGQKVLKGIGHECDLEGLAAILDLKDWIPAYKDGIVIRQRQILPVVFSLGSVIKADQFGLHDGNVLPSIPISVIGLNKNLSNKGESSGENFPMHRNAQYPGGWERLKRYIKKNIQKFESIPINKEGDRVTVRFVVNENGEISNANVQKGLGDPFDQEAKKLISEMPKWKPALRNYQPVNDTLETKIYFGSISEMAFNKSIDLNKKAIAYFNKGELERSLKLYNKAIKKNPTYYYFYYDKALILLRLSKNSEACNTLELIKDIDQDALNLYLEYCKN